MFGETLIRMPFALADPFGGCRRETYAHLYRLAALRHEARESFACGLVGIAWCRDKKLTQSFSMVNPRKRIGARFGFFMKARK